MRENLLVAPHRACRHAAIRVCCATLEPELPIDMIMFPSAAVLTLWLAQAPPPVRVVPQAEWRAITLDGAPIARADETAVSTGREVVIFGGLDHKDRYLGDGAAYDPTSDAWRSIASEDAPGPRAWHTAVWTGREMIVWGGDDKDGESRDGAAYDPRTDRWRTMTEVGAPTARGSHVSVWTGNEMLVWAGVDEEHAFPRGGLYDPRQDQWRPLTIDVGKHTPRTIPGVWTGRAFLAWGGINGSSVLGHGVAFDPAKGEPRLMTTNDAPSARAGHAAVWTGREFVIWGGSRSILGGLPLGDGARYDPVEKRWRPLTKKGAPPPRHGHASVWTGVELLILGGATKRAGDALRDAWAWHPKQGWRRMPDLPEPRTAAHAFATARGVLLLGGRDSKRLRRGGYLLAPSRPKGVR